MDKYILDLLRILCCLVTLTSLSSLLPPSLEQEGVVSLSHILEGNKYQQRIMILSWSIGYERNLATRSKRFFLSLQDSQMTSPRK